jgi:hypothetical protein
MIRIAVAVLVVIGLVLALGRHKRRADTLMDINPKTLRPYDAPGQTDSGDRSPLDPADPQLSGGAAKRLGEEE